MKSYLRSGLIFSLLFFAWLPNLSAQQRIAKIVVEFIGPATTSESLVRANIRCKVGEPLSSATLNEDVKNLFATGYFIDIRTFLDNTGEGLVVRYQLQGKPLLTAIKFSGNKKYSQRKLKKKVKSKINEPMDRQKLFQDAQEVQKIYEHSGRQKTTVEAVTSIEGDTGKGSVTFEVHEEPKIIIKDLVFDNAKAFKQKKLRKQLKTKRHWMFSFLTSSGVLKEEEFEDDQDRLKEFYQNEGYIDFQIRGIITNKLSRIRSRTILATNLTTGVVTNRVEEITPKTAKWTLHFDLAEGTQYKVGRIEFKGNQLFSTNEFLNGLSIDKQMRKLHMTVGKTFTPGGLNRDVETLQDFYGSKGYIDAYVNAIKQPNPTTGTMDLLYEIKEGKQAHIEQIQIKGNTKTKDRVIRRELAVSPGEVFDMVRVKLSKTRLENLDYFEKVDTRSEDSDAGPDQKNLVVGVDEKNTGQLLVGAGFSSVDSLVGFVEVTQGNFDLFHPPTFTGGGQKARLRAQVGTVRQDYEATFIEPWFLGRKLAFEADAFYRDLGFYSRQDIYSEIHGGGSLSLTKALGSDFLKGTVTYTLESIDLRLNSGFHTNDITTTKTNADGSAVIDKANVSPEIYNERGSRLVSKIGTLLAYDTRNSPFLPDRGQRTTLFTEVAGSGLGGDTDIYKLELSTARYFKGFGEGHVLELAGRMGVVQNYGSTDRVPLSDRWFLGGLYTLRGYRFREIGPQDRFDEALGGNTYFFASAEYSIPIIERLRFAVFYDIGNVYSKSYSFKAHDELNPINSKVTRRGAYSDNWGVGLRINIPHLGPLRLDYGIPLTHDSDANSSGRFQFGVGFQRPF